MLKPGAAPMPILPHDEFDKRYRADPKDIAPLDSILKNVKQDDSNYKQDDSSY
jgi:hypothetical protein